MTDKRKDCPMRHENGNCTVAGGFCTAVNDPMDKNVITGKEHQKKCVYNR